MLKTTSNYCYPFSRAQHPTQCAALNFSIELFENAHSLDVSPWIVAQDSPKKYHFNKCQVVKSCCFFVGGCWLTLPKIYTRGCKISKVLKKKMLFMTCYWKSWLLKGKSCRVVGVLQAIWTVRIENWYLAVPAWQAKKLQNGCKQAQKTGICNSCQDSRLHKKLGDLGKHEKKGGGGFRMVRYPPLYNSADRDAQIMLLDSGRLNSPENQHLTTQRSPKVVR